MARSLPAPDKIPVVHYKTERVPDDRPGAGELSGDQFWSVRDRIVAACREHGPVGPDDRETGCDYDDFVYWVVEDQYNDERYQYVEICKAAGATVPWLLDLMKTLRRARFWGVGIEVPEGYLLVFEDRVMVSGPTFRDAHTVGEVLARIRQAEELTARVEACRTDADLEALSRVPGIKTKAMRLDLADATDAGMEYLAHMRGIVSLCLGQKVTDAGLASLRGLKKLNTLCLGEAITDRGLKHLRGLTALDELNLAVTGITDEGLGHLRGLPRLETLVLSGTAVSDRGLARLGPLKDSLEVLDLRATDVTDKGMKHLARLKQLRRLDLTHTRIGDAGLAELQALSSLEEIDLKDTLCTEEGVATFHASTEFLAAPSEKYLESAIRFERLGGWVILEESGEGKKQKSTSVYLRSGWRGDDLSPLRNLAPVRWIQFESERVTDDLILQLRGLPHVEGIRIHGAAITAQGLAVLRSLPRFDRLFLEDMAVSAAMLAQLANVLRLDWLGLDQGRLVDSAGEQLANLTQLGRLELKKTNLGKAALRKLKKQLRQTEIVVEA
jgi:hypothetical protein